VSDDISLVELVLQRVRATADPPPGSFRRVLSGVERQVVGSAPDLHDAGAAPPDPAPLPALSPPLAAVTPRAWAPHVARLGRWVVFGLATGGVGYLWGSQGSAPVSLQHSAVAPVEQRSVAPPIALSPPQPSALSEPDPAPRLTPSAQLRAAPSRHRAVARSSEPLGLHEALQLLSRAQSVLRRGWPERALELLAELEQRQPGELLLEERRVTRILALCELGEVDQAQAARQELGSGPASSIYAGRLAASCTGVEHTTTGGKSRAARPDPAAADTPSHE